MPVVAGNPLPNATPFFLRLSPQLNILISIITNDSAPKISFSKKEMIQRGDVKVVKKAVIQLSLEEYSLLKSATDLTDSFLELAKQQKYVQLQAAKDPQGSSKWNRLILVRHKCMLRRLLSITGLVLDILAEHDINISYLSEIP